MRDGLNILALVPARSGSKGIPDKNLQEVGGLSLIARAGRVLAEPSLACVDYKLLSTDSPRYAELGRESGLDCPFLRPAELATDTSSAVDTIRQAWSAAEVERGMLFDILLLLEPTCPLRLAEDVSRTLDALLKSGADSAITVSLLDTKFNPYKILTRDADNKLGFYQPTGAGVTARQDLPRYYYRNGACYGLRKRAIFDLGAIFGEQAEAVVIDRALVNIDEPFDLHVARWLAEGETS